VSTGRAADYKTVLLGGMCLRLIMDDIVYACEIGDVDGVRTMLANRRVDPAAQENEAIRAASSRGYVEIVRMLLADGRADPAANENIAIYFASVSGHVEIVRMLLADERVDPSARRNNVIDQATVTGQVEIVRMLLADGRVNPAASRAMFNACFWGRVQIVRMLLDDGRVVPSVIDIGIASEHDKKEIVQMLIADGRANPADQNNYAIRHAIRHFDQRVNIDIVSILLRDGRVRRQFGAVIPDAHKQLWDKLVDRYIEYVKYAAEIIRHKIPMDIMVFHLLSDLPDFSLCLDKTPKDQLKKLFHDVEVINRLGS
jgi:hypothetical protein